MSANTNPENPTRRTRLRLAALGVSSAAVVGLMVGMNGVYAENPATPATQPAVSSAVPWTGYADLIEQVMPSVVGITAQRAPRETVADMPEGGAPNFEEFFGDRGGPEGEMFERFMERFFGERGREQFRMPQHPPRDAFPRMAAGSGFIISDDGLIVTNNHVIDGAGEVTVKLHDGTELTASVIGRDPDTDLALLKVDTDQPLQPVEFADSDAVRVGDPAIAIGSPFGLGGTVTAGIVSANNRVIGAGRYDDFLQVDAPINRGNSGGPTFDIEGRVIGVNTAIHTPTGGNVGIGFAIPANLVVDVVEQLREHGQVERGWLGVHIQALDPDLAASLGLEEATGALVSQVTPDSPAAAAGLERGDVILSFGEREIGDIRDLTRTVADVKPGTTVDAVVWRDGEQQTLAVEVGQMPGQQQVALAEDMSEEQEEVDTTALGVSLAQLTDEARHELDLAEDVQGVIITEVQPDSPAAEKGLRRGDVIVEADHQEVSDPTSVTEAVQAATERGAETVLLLVKRDGQDRFVAIPLERA